MPGVLAARTIHSVLSGVIRQRFAASARALTEATERTGSMYTDSGQRMGHLFGTRVVRDVMEEMSALQARSATTRSTELPLLPDGLVPTPDGLAWQEPTP